MASLVTYKTNEQPGTRARASYIRGSASKVRHVLDLIRGKSCTEASEILAFCERDAARDVNKVLESAIANAEKNDNLDEEELYVSACYADEGPTLKRIRPRARGRATSIFKRTCHITVIVSRYGEDSLDEFRSRRARLGAQPSENRERRVARSRAAAGEPGADMESDPSASTDDRDAPTDVSTNAPDALTDTGTQVAEESVEQAPESEESAAGSALDMSADEVGEAADKAGAVAGEVVGEDPDEVVDEAGEVVEGDSDDGPRDVGEVVGEDSGKASGGGA